jgi:hypothetical protein
MAAGAEVAIGLVEELAPDRLGGLIERPVIGWECAPFLFRRPDGVPVALVTQLILEPVG